MSARRMKLDQFIAWADEAPGRWQLEDGFAAAIGPAPPIRGVIHASLATLLTMHLRETRPGWHVGIGNGLVPKALGTWNIRVAHVAVFDHVARASVRYASDPLLVGMIVSPDNQRQAWSNVWTFTTLPSVREIVVVHASAKRAEVLRRAADGSWPDDFQPVEHRLALDSVAVTIAFAELYRGTEFVDA